MYTCCINTEREIRKREGGREGGREREREKEEVTDQILSTCIGLQVFLVQRISSILS